MKATFGLGIYDNNFQTVDITWDVFVEYMTEQAGLVRRPSDKDKAPWVAPFATDGTSRKADAVTEIGEWIAIDLDAEGWTLQRINASLKGMTRIIHTTTKSTPSHQRWRFIVRLDRSYSVAEFQRVWQFFNIMFDRELDASTKNANRISYVPALWWGADNVFEVYSAGVVSVDWVLAQIPYEKLTEWKQPVAALIVPTERPADIPIITPGLIVDFNASKPGGRWYKMMVKAAMQHRRCGWALTATELAGAALAVSQLDSEGKRRTNALGEAGAAIKWAEAHV